MHITLSQFYLNTKRFSLWGNFYKFTFLPNGLCSAPRKFTKLLKPPLAKLRLDYIKIAAYIDDLITSAYSFDICFKDVWKRVKLFNYKSTLCQYYNSPFIASVIWEAVGLLTVTKLQNQFGTGLLKDYVCLVHISLVD